MKIIFGQGNPGAQYATTRHNVGFMTLDALAKQWGITFLPKPKFQADIAETIQNGKKILLVKPTTFYNETGHAARALMDFYKLDPTKDFLVIHDELALPFGNIKTRLSGSDAGNNGIKSLNSHLGLHYARIRIGIYNPLRDRVNDADFVLAKFTQDEHTILPLVISQAQYLVSSFLAGTFTPTTIIVSSPD
jgi:PTH1 family peptidyl-tRNA hydrolase